MSDQMPTFNYTNYSKGISLLAQQMMSKTVQAVTIKSEMGKKVSFDRVGATTMQEKTARAAPIPTVNTPHDRRWLTNRNYYMRDFIDEFEKLDILNDPTNAYSQSFAAAGARRIDKIVVDAALGTALSGEDGATSITLAGYNSGSQLIAAGGTGFTLDKLQQGKQKLLTANAVMPGDSIHVFYTAKLEKGFINTTEVKSSDFNRDRVMVNGELEYFYGCYFHRLEDDGGIGAMLPLSGSTRSCVMFLKSGINLNLRKPVYGRVDWLSERESYQVMAGLSAGAVRNEEVKVVKIDAVES